MTGRTDENRQKRKWEWEQKGKVGGRDEVLLCLNSERDVVPWEEGIYAVLTAPARTRLETYRHPHSVLVQKTSTNAYNTSYQVLL